jgi:hypothetical protein
MQLCWLGNKLWLWQIIIPELSDTIKNYLGSEELNMANKIFRDHIINNIKKAMHDFSNATRVNHPGLKGRIREIVLSNLFRPILPLGMEIGNGKIIDYLDNQSRETDVIIYTRNILAPILYDEKTGMFPIESCIYAIEIKSKLTASEIKDSIAKGEDLRSLKYMVNKYLINKYLLLLQQYMLSKRIWQSAVRVR